MHAAKKKLCLLAGLVAGVGMTATTWAQTAPRPSHPCDVYDPERPYICDIGPPKPLSSRSFREILTNDSAIRAVVRRIGIPYSVEMQRVRADDPWYTWEVRAYYPAYNRMYAFGRAFILGNPEVSLLRYEGPIPADWWRMTVTAPGPSDADSAAARAERAAAEAEEIADRATQYADRAEAIADQAGRDFKQSLVKH